MTKHHGMTALTGMAAYCKRSHSPTREDRFGRMFPNLSPAYVPANLLAAIGRKDGPMDGQAGKATSVPVGQVIFGQFIDHDITLDTSSGIRRVNTAEETPNVRTPTMDLDCIYGSGPEAHAYLYSQTAPFSGVKLLTGADMPGATQAQQNDLMRAPNGRAIIGDHRNDENRVVSQMQLAMIKFHNQIVDALHADPATTLEGHDLFEEARRVVTWHYQWAVVNDFLVDMCGGAVVNEILGCGRQHYCPDGGPFIPIEFAVAAYRFGHSMVPMQIQVHSGGGHHRFFGDVLGTGFSPVASTDAVIDWREVFFEPDKTGVQRAEKLDTQMAGDLLKLPFIDDPKLNSLATRNLLRGNSFLLPGGEKVAEAMGRPQAEIDTVMARIQEISQQAIASSGVDAGPITKGAPLWLYILAEAEVIGRETAPGAFDPGEGLGPVGARIVAEVLIGLLELDEHSYLGADRNWTPDTTHDSIGKIMVSTNAGIF
ncbi:MAG: heme peroxidase family protein [Pseudomonadota bacterium]